MLIRKQKNEQLSRIELAYLKARSLEDRIYSDDIVRQLPYIDKKHPQYKEWQIRKNSLEKITAYLKSETSFKTLLDLGCGNGWMSNALQKQDYRVTGVDINAEELEQAARLFPEIDFYELDILEDAHELQKFDAIVISAALQYFEFPSVLIEKLKNSHLRTNGAIIVADTKFYTSSELSAAKQRSAEYYRSLNAEEMAGYYFHHNIEIMHHLHARAIENKGIFRAIYSRINGVYNPFTIYVIK